MIKIYQVGGSIRDELLGVKSKDLDFAVEAPSFEAMEKYIVENGGQIYLSNPEFYTIRANFRGVAADYVLCRKDGVYTDGRRPDKVEAGTIFDDLSRRDFCCNAIAKCEDGTLYDPYGGIQDIKDKVIRCVGKACDRFMEDSLRVLRAIRFSITKNFSLDIEVVQQIHSQVIINQLRNVSQDRIREELHKCFRANTLRTLQLLEYYSALRDAIFPDGGGIWLKPTTEL